MTPSTLLVLIAYLLGTFFVGLAIGVLYDKMTKELEQL